MTISAICSNGHKLNAKGKLAGKRVKCPKCGSVVQIPELESVELDEVQVLDEAAPQPESDASPNGTTSDPGADDPFGLGNALEGLDPLAADPLTDPLGGDPLAGDPLAGGSLDDWSEQAAPSTPAPGPTATSRAPGAPSTGKQPAGAPSTGKHTSGKRAAASASAAKLTMPVILAISGGGIVVGLLCLGLVGWFLFGGGGDETASVDPVSPAVTDAPAATPDSTAPVATAPAEPTPAEPSPASPASSSPAPAAPPPQPWDLVPIAVDSRLGAFKLPGTTWAAAYDEDSGRLAITHDEKGILFYNLDKLAEGVVAPETSMGTNGLPAALCLKPLGDRRVFVIAGQAKPELLLIEAKTLRQIGRVVLPGVQYVDFLTGSPNPEDPYVYYSTANEHDDDSMANRLGRVDLLTGERDGHT